MKTLTLVVSILALAGSAVLGAQKPVTVADFAGTWNITIMSHQIALVIEPAADNNATATMMAMGTDIPLKGELVDGTLTLVGVKPADADAGHAAPRLGAKPITARLLDDGTIEGEMMTSAGPAQYSGEKLRKKKG
mgnify:CR=1 FL=1